MSLGNESLSSSADVLRASEIAELLKTYLNQRFVDTIISIAILGARVGFQGNFVGRTQRSNHSSAFIHLEVISESIQTEFQKEWVQEISDLPLNYFCSSIGLVLKQVDDIQTEWKVISDFSSPVLFPLFLSFSLGHARCSSL